MLLRSTDLVRFVPNGQNATSGDITFRAWDQTSGAAGNKVDASTNGTTTAFSTATEVASITVTAVNDAPVLDNTGNMTLTTITEDETTNGGNTVASIILSAGGDRITDVDSGAVEGIAITATTNGNGSWEYSIDNGSNWLSVGSVADNNALLLRSTDLVRFVPNGQNATTGDITFRAWDQTSGAAGNKVDASTNGNTTAFSMATEVASITVTAVNDAPVLDNTGNMTLTTITEDETTNSGNTVASIISSAGGDRITDVDSGAIEGIALTATTNGNGAWEYSIDNGSNWVAVGSVADNNALLLRSTDLVRFVPNGQNATSGDITFRAWDQTSGAAGNKVDASTNGTTTAFSTATEVASITVTAVNDAPVLDNTGNMTLTTITEDATTNSGNTVASIISSAGGDRITDIDSGAVEGIAITATTNGNGAWEYSIDNGSNWLFVGAVANNSALLLRSTDLVRFVPNGQNATTGDITFRAWDQTSGTAGNKVDTSTNGTTTAFSTATEVASITVTAVNDAPVLDNTGTTVFTNIDERDTNNSGDTIAALLASAGGDRLTDVDAGAFEGIAVTATVNGNGGWEYSVDGGTNWATVGTVSDSSALLLRSVDRLRFVPDGLNATTGSITFYGWDQSGTTVGLEGSKVDVSTRGGTTPFSTASEIASISVTSVNDAPVANPDTASAVEAGGLNNGVAGSDPTGNVLTNDTDVDAGDTRVVWGVMAGGSGNPNADVGISVSGSYGNITIQTDGTFAYVVNNAHVDVQALRTNGQSLTDVFTYTVRDTGGLTDTTQITITITGVNDAPIAIDDTDTAVEAGGLNNGTAGSNATGNVLTNDTDVDSVANGETKTVVDFATVAAPATTVTAGNSINGNYGAITIGTNGAYTYTIDETNVSVQALRVTGQTLSDAFVYTMTDTAGATSQATITITITGVNDTPIAVDDTDTAVEAGGLNNGTAGSNATGNVLTNDTDVDSVANGETKTVFDFATVATPATTVTAGNSISGNYGAITIGANGAYTYTIDETNAAAQALRVTGQTLTDAFVYTMTDTAGATSQATITVTITGVNDTPIAVDDTGTAVEAGGLNNGTAGSNATGNVLTNDTDVDSVANGETKTLVDFATVAAPATTVTAGNNINGNYGAIIIGTNGAYTYTIDESNTAVQALRVTGQTLTDAFVYTMTDTAGATSQATLTITITGVNDTPIAVDDTGTAVESGGLSNGTAGSNATGNVLTNDTDVDSVANGETKTVVDFATVAAPATTVTAGNSINGNYGSIAIGSNGAYTYAIDETNAAVQALRVTGQTLTDAFVYTMTDTAGATSQATITITITGVNDTPVAVDDTGTAVEAGGLNNGAVGSNATGNVLTNDTDVDSVANGETKTVVDIATVAAPTTTVTAGNSINGNFGAITIGANGTYTYTIDETNASVQALRVTGQTLTDAFVYTMTDTAGATSQATITITITGVNDTPVAVDDSGIAVESGGLNNGTAGSNANGNVLSNDTDVDSIANGETKTVVDIATVAAPATTVTAGNSINGNYGAIIIGANGAYTYTIDETNAAVQALRVTGQTLTDAFVYTMTDTVGATSQATITVTITGVNDTPIAVDDTGTAVEAGGLNNGTAGSNATGNVLTNDTDVDSVANGETKTIIDFATVAAPATTVTAGNNINGNYGAIIIGTNGAYTYTIDETNAAVQALRVTGQTLTDAFVYTMTDTAGATSQATITVTITGVNDTPIAMDDTGTAVESGGLNNGTAGSNATGNVLTNDTDVDSVANGETKIVVDFATVAAPATTVTAGNSINGNFGAITIGANGAYTYTIDETNASVQSLRVTGQTLTDAFVYTMTDTAGATSQATITITITAANDTPIAVDDTGIAVESGGLNNGTTGSNATGMC